MSVAQLDLPEDAGARVQDYWALLKPRVMLLVVVSGIGGMAIAPGHLHPVLAFVAILCIALSAGAAGAINMWYDRDIDAIMERTQARPIPAGRVAADEALAFGLTLEVFAVMVMGLAVNWLAASLLAGAAAFYVLVYTMGLKRRTPQNIVIGGAAGAVPPMIGWAAVTGDVGWPSVALFMLILLWTPPHFWALALNRAEDYARAGVPMLPVTHGDRATRWQIVIYSALMLPFAVAPSLMGAAGPVYLVSAFLLSAIFLAAAIAVLVDRRDVTAKRLFAYSILYLFLLFAVLIGERIA